MAKFKLDTITFYWVIQKIFAIGFHALTWQVMLYLKHTYIFQQINIHACESEGLSPLVSNVDLLASGGGNNKLICISHHPYFSAPLKNLWKTSFRPPPVAVATHSAVHGWELQTVSGSSLNPQASVGNCWTSSLDVPTFRKSATPSSAALDAGAGIPFTLKPWPLPCQQKLDLPFTSHLSAEGFRYEFPWALVWDMLCLCRTANPRIPPYQTHRWPSIVQGGGVHITQEYLCQRATGPH